MRRACAILATTVLLAAGCGGDESSDTSAGGAATDQTTTTTPTETTTTEKTTTPTTKGGDQAGAQLFTENCGGCHTLKAAGTNGTVGPNLDELKPSESTVKRQVTNGGSKMPAFKGRLSADEIKAVSKYVADTAGSG